MYSIAILYSYVGSAIEGGYFPLPYLILYYYNLCLNTYLFIYQLFNMNNFILSAY
jgi:hypothetical protein